MSKKQEDKFNFFIPLTIEKGNVGTGEMKFKGICSSKVEDSDGETLHPEGFDFSPLMEKGYINYNHQAGKEAGKIIGRPTKLQVINDGRDLYVEGVLYNGVKEAEDVYALAKALENDPTGRKLGFSIEGKSDFRDPFNPKKVLKATLTGLAVTASPKNPNTFLNIMKGEQEQDYVTDNGQEDEDSSLTENLDGTQMSEDTEKALTAETVTNTSGVPDIEGAPKKLLAKSEIYKSLISKYDIDNIEKAKEIYSFIDNVNTKLYKNMEGITSEALVKAFEFLDTQINIDELEKSGGPGSRGGKVIGTTSSGKPIYDTGAEKGTKWNDLSDHIEKVGGKTGSLGGNPYSGDDTVEHNYSSENSRDKSFSKIKDHFPNHDIKTENGKDKFGQKYHSIVVTPKKDLKKSEGGIQDENDEIEASKKKEEMEKSKEYAVENLKKGMSKDENIEDCIRKGISLSESQKSVESAIAEYEAGEKEGGAITAVSDPTILLQLAEHSKAVAELTKAIEALTAKDTLQKAENVETETSLSELLKAQNEGLNDRFSSMGVILKSVFENSELLKAKVEDLTFENEELKTTVNAIAKSSDGPKSVQRVTAKPVDRFQKSEQGENGSMTYQLSDKASCGALTDRLFADYTMQKSKGIDDNELRKAIESIEFTKTLTPAFQARLEKQGINVVR